MAAAANRWKLGAFVVAGVLTAFGAVLWLGTAQLRREVVPAVTFVDESVQGLEVGAPVKLRGVPIGAVSRIGFAPDRRRVRIDMDIYLDMLRALGVVRPDGTTLAQATRENAERGLRVQLAAAGITGVVFISLDLFDPKSFPAPELEFEPPEYYIPAVPSTIKSIADAAVEAARIFPEVAEKVSRLLVRAERLIEEIDAGRVAADIRRTLATLDAKLAAVDAASLSTRTAATLDEATGTMRAARRVAEKLEPEIEPFKRDIERIESLARTIEDAVKDARLGETAASARAAADGVAGLSRDAGALAADLRAQLATLREAVDALRRLADMLERDPAALLHGKTPETPPGEGRTRP